VTAGDHCASSYRTVKVADLHGVGQRYISPDHAINQVDAQPQVNQQTRTNRYFIHHHRVALADASQMLSFTTPGGSPDVDIIQFYNSIHHSSISGSHFATQWPILLHKISSKPYKMTLRPSIISLNFMSIHWIIMNAK
jgi:hypothetical protein